MPENQSALAEYNRAKVIFAALFPVIIVAAKPAFLIAIGLGSQIFHYGDNYFSNNAPKLMIFFIGIVWWYSILFKRIGHAISGNKVAVCLNGRKLTSPYNQAIDIKDINKISYGAGYEGPYVIIHHGQDYDTRINCTFFIGRNVPLVENMRRLLPNIVIDKYDQQTTVLP